LACHHWLFVNKQINIQVPIRQKCFSSGGTKKHIVEIVSARVEHLQNLQMIFIHFQM